MEYNNDNNFRNVIDISPKKEKNHTIKNNVVLPFIAKNQFHPAKNISITEGKVSENTVYDATVEYGKDEAEAYEHWVNQMKDDYNVESIPLN